MSGKCISCWVFSFVHSFKSRRCEAWTVLVVSLNQEGDVVCKYTFFCWGSSEGSFSLFSVLPKQTKCSIVFSLKEKKEQRYLDDRVGYVQYRGDDTKGLKHKIFLHSFLVYPPLLLFAVRDSAVMITACEERHLYDHEKSIYHTIIKRVLVSYVYDFVWHLYAQCFSTTTELSTYAHRDRGDAVFVVQWRSNICLKRVLLLWCALYVWFWPHTYIKYTCC